MNCYNFSNTIQMHIRVYRSIFHGLELIARQSLNWIHFLKYLNPKSFSIIGVNTDVVGKLL